MIELIKIILQITFIAIIFAFSFVEIKKFKFINNLNSFDKTSINIILFLNAGLIFSLIGIQDILLFILIVLMSIFVFVKKFNNIFISNFKFQYIYLLFFIIIFIISIDISYSLDLGWDAKYFWFLKTLNFYHNQNFNNLINIPAFDYPHLGSYVWSFFWKYPFNSYEYNGRIFYAFIYCLSIFSFFYNLKISNLLKILLILSTLLLSYEYSYFSGLQEILIFSLILISAKLSILFFEEKNKNNRIFLLLILLGISNITFWIKLEGFILMSILIVCLNICFKTNVKEKSISLIGLIFIIFFKIIILANFKTELSSFEFEETFYNNNFSNLLEDVKIIFYYLFIYITQVPLFIICLIAFMITFFINKSNDNIKKFVTIYAILNILFIFVSFLFTMEDVEWQSRVGMKRVLFETSGFYLITIAYLLKKNKNIFK